MTGAKITLRESCEKLLDSYVELTRALQECGKEISCQNYGLANRVIMSAGAHDSFGWVQSRIVEIDKLLKRGSKKKLF